MRNEHVALHLGIVNVSNCGELEQVVRRGHGRIIRSGLCWEESVVLEGVLQIELLQEEHGAVA